MGDVRAAAERVERFTRIATQGTPNQAPAYRDAAYMEVYCGTPHTQMEDFRALALAYLAEHPDDDQLPVDEEWLRSIGFEAEGGWLALQRLRFSFYKGWNAWWAFGAVGATRLVDDVPTRRHVRALLSALGVPARG